jgi:cell division protein ZapE
MKNKTIKFDLAQKEFIALTSTISTTINDQNLVTLLKNKLFNKERNNIYLHGPVGVGKTILLKEFCNKLHCTKWFTHYQLFIQFIHQQLRLITSKDMMHKFSIISKDIANKYKYIFIDEFEINDIADAMIMQPLFKSLIKENVYISMSSNTSPTNLYKDGLKRENFEPFIQIIEGQFIIYELKSDIDYRKKKSLQEKTKILYPYSDPKIHKKLLSIIEELLDKNTFQQKIISGFGRDITLSKTYKNIVMLSFQNICIDNLAYNDFITISENFDIIIVDKIPYISAEETDKILRFIQLVDMMYFKQKILFLTLEDSPENIYKSGTKSAEFKRTVSRLYEMNN